MKHSLNLGAAIKHFRLLSGMSQLVLADRCGFNSQSRISQYESNSREPSTADLAIMCKVLGVDSASMMRQASVAAGNKVKSATAYHEELQTKFDLLQVEHQFLVLEMIKALLGEMSPSQQTIHEKTLF